MEIGEETPYSFNDVRGADHLSGNMNIFRRKVRASAYEILRHVVTSQIFWEGQIVEVESD